MLSSNNIKVLHLEVTNKCQASCPMCARNLQGGVDNPFLHLNEITLDKFIKWFDESFIQNLDKLYMCGNLGDPIIAHDTLKIFEYCRQVNLNIQLSMNTNGSARNRTFWEGLAKANVIVRFGIDGLSDTHNLYRKGTNFENIIANAKTFIEAGGHAIWDMLVFQHNQHQVKECKALSESMGFKEFIKKDTSRFKEDKLDVLDVNGKKIYTLFPSDKSKKLTKLTANNQGSISCKVEKEKSLYVTSNGIVTPCCWLGIDELPHVNPSRIDYLTKIGKFYSLQENTLKEIFESMVFERIKDTWNLDPLLECSRQCGSFDKFKEQFTYESQES